MVHRHLSVVRGPLGFVCELLSTSVDDFTICPFWVVPGDQSVVFDLFSDQADQMLGDNAHCHVIISRCAIKTRARDS